jgi:hypothetical protein
VALSRDGKYVAATSQKGVPPVTTAYRVSASTGVALNLMPPQASDCFPTAISEDGAWIAGQCHEGVVSRAFYWTENGGAAFYDPELGVQLVSGMSADARVLFGLRQRTLTGDGAAGAGGSDSASNDFEKVFRWGADGTFVDHSVGPEHWVPGDATPIVIINSYSFSAGVPSVYRWSSQTDPQPMTVGTGLEYYDEYYAMDVARQLDITVGFSRWEDGKSSSSSALIWNRSRVASHIAGGYTAVACNRDCSVIAGVVTDAHDQSGPGVWTNLSPPDSAYLVRAEAHLLIELLGVTTDLDGWSLGDIVAMSNDGKVLAGNGKLNGKATGWVIHL